MKIAKSVLFMTLALQVLTALADIQVEDKFTMNKFGVQLPEEYYDGFHDTADMRIIEASYYPRSEHAYCEFYEYIEDLENPGESFASQAACIESFPIKAFNSIAS